jgi:hypothetical protein
LTIKGVNSVDTSFLNLIGNVGFPIAVTAFLLMRLEQRLASLEKSISSLTMALVEHTSVHFEPSGKQ